MSAHCFLLAAHGQVMHNPIMHFCLCDLRPCLPGLYKCTDSPFAVPTCKVHMQGSLELEPDRPRRNIRVFGVKMIPYFYTALSSKQALRTPPVLLKNVGRSPG